MREALYGITIFFPILYFVVRAAVEDGTLRALIEYDKLKNQESKNE